MPPGLAPTMRTDLDTVAVALLLAALGSIMVRRFDHLALLLAVQGALLTAAAALAVSQHGDPLAWLGVLATAAIKAVAIPGVLLLAAKDMKMRAEAQAVLTRKQALPMGVALILVAYHVAAPLGSTASLESRHALPAAIGMLLLGLFNMLTRRKAAAHVVALVTMENGLYLAAIAATGGLPLAVELGVALDVLVGVVVMAVVFRQMYRTFDTMDTDNLSTLRG